MKSPFSSKVVRLLALCGTVIATPVLQASAQSANDNANRPPASAGTVPAAVIHRPRVAPLPPPPNHPNLPITKPQPRVIVQPGKPLVYTTVPPANVTSGGVPWGLTRAPQPVLPPCEPTVIRSRNAGFGGSWVRFPNVLSPSKRVVPETTFAPTRPFTPSPKPWPCPTGSGGHRNGAVGNTSVIGVNGGVISNGSSVSFGTGSGLTIDGSWGSSSGSNLSVRLGSVPTLRRHCPTPPVNDPCWDPCSNPSRPVCGPSYPTWDHGWWTWYSPAVSYAPVYGSGFVQYDPNLFYSDANRPARPAPADVAEMTEEDRNELLIREVSSLMSANRFRTASASLGEYLRRVPDDPGAWRWLGIALLSDRKTKDAVDAFAKAYELNPAIADLPLEYDAMGMTKPELRELCSPLLTYARVTRSPHAAMMAAVIMDARGLDAQAVKLLDEARSRGLDPALTDRLRTAFRR
jgi:hypothetical protein